MGDVISQRSILCRLRGSSIFSSHSLCPWIINVLLYTACQCVWTTYLSCKLYMRAPSSSESDPRVSRIHARTVVFHYRFPWYRTILDAYVLSFIRRDNAICLLLTVARTRCSIYTYIYVNLSSLAKNCDTVRRWLGKSRVRGLRWFSTISNVFFMLLLYLTEDYTSSRKWYAENTIKVS